MGLAYAGSRARVIKKSTPNKFLDKMATDETHVNYQILVKVVEPLSGQSGQTLKDSGELMYTFVFPGTPERGSKSGHSGHFTSMSVLVSKLMWPPLFTHN